MERQFLLVMLENRLTGLFELRQAKLESNLLILSIDKETACINKDLKELQFTIGDIHFKVLTRFVFTFCSFIVMQRSRTSKKISELHKTEMNLSEQTSKNHKLNATSFSSLIISLYRVFCLNEKPIMSVLVVYKKTVTCASNNHYTKIIEMTLVLTQMFQTNDFVREKLRQNTEDGPRKNSNLDSNH